MRSARTKKGSLGVIARERSDRGNLSVGEWVVRAKNGEIASATPRNDGERMRSALAKNGEIVSLRSQ